MTENVEYIKRARKFILKAMDDKYLSQESLDNLSKAHELLNSPYYESVGKKSHRVD